MDATSPRRLLFTTGWWKTAARTFALLEFIALWFAFFLLLLGPHAPSTKRWAAAIVIAPLPLTALFATLRERQRDPELRFATAQGSLAFVLGWFTFPLIVGPVSLLGFIMLTRFTYEYSMSQAKGPDRPFLSSNVGFCAPPRYFVREGLPVASLTARVPESGRYRFRAQARGRLGRFVVGRVDTTLQRGVHRVDVPMSYRGSVALRPGDIVWPLTVQRILVRSIEERDGVAVWSDTRQGDSLATIALGDSIAPTSLP